jgi:hypothetical protein
LRTCPSARGIPVNSTQQSVTTLRLCNDALPFEPISFFNVVVRVALVLKHANKNRLGAIDWGPNDFDVLDEDRRCIGRIFLSVQAPEGRPWFWTITAREYPPTIHSRGSSATREQAMVEFKAQWLSHSSQPQSR